MNAFLSVFRFHFSSPIRQRQKNKKYSDASVGTEELNHIEMVCTIVHQLTRNLTIEQIKEQGFADYYVDHTTGIYPIAASGTPWSADTMQSTGDPITDLMEDMAAEQKARTTYDNILRLVKDDPDVYTAIKFLREREIVHFQRFGEAKSSYTSKMIKKRIVYRNFVDNSKSPYTKVSVIGSI